MAEEVSTGWVGGPAARACLQPTAACTHRLGDALLVEGKEPAASLVAVLLVHRRALVAGLADGFAWLRGGADGRDERVASAAHGGRTPARHCPKRTLADFQSTSSSPGKSAVFGAGMGPGRGAGAAMASGMRVDSAVVGAVAAAVAATPMLTMALDADDITRLCFSCMYILLGMVAMLRLTFV